MADDDTCRLRVVADRPGCRVDVCGHGHIHVNLGAVTLRLRPAQFETLRRTLNEAATDVATQAPPAEERPGIVH